MNWFIKRAVKKELRILAKEQQKREQELKKRELEELSAELNKNLLSHGDHISACSKINDLLEMRHHVFQVCKGLNRLIKMDLEIKKEESLDIDKEETQKFQELLYNTRSNLMTINATLFPDHSSDRQIGVDPDRQKEIDQSWADVDWYDFFEIYTEAKEYANSSVVDNMTLEEVLDLIEEHNPSFAKEMRKNLAADKAMREYPQC